MNKGDYVRTKYGIIAKITNIIEDLSIDCDIDVYYEDNLKDKMPMMEIPYNLKDEYIIKSSPKIIDLVQVGDYVNGYKVIEKGVYQDNEKCITVDFDTEYDDLHWGEINEFTDKDIKSIVTKEQFSAMEYKVESEVK